MSNYQLKETILDAKTVIGLRQSAGWSSLSEQTMEKALANSLFFVSIWCNDKAVAMGRIVGDGYQYFYLQDIIVHPDHQKQGLSMRIIENLVDHVKETAEPEAFFALMAAKGASGLYKKFGFVERPDNMPGMSLPLLKDCPEVVDG